LAAVLFLVFAGVIEGLVTVFAGDPIAQASGQVRTWGLVCCLLAGLLGVSYWAVMRPSFKLEFRLERLALLVPGYAFWQVVPLPIAWIRVLSPARARLAYALQPITSVPHWLPISATPSATLHHALLFSACTSLFLVTYDLSQRLSRRLWIVALPLVVVGLAQTAIGLLQAGAGPEGVATGTFLIRNHYAGFLEMVLPFCALFPFLAAAGRGSNAPAEDRSSPVAAILLGCLVVAIAALMFAAILASLSRMGFFASMTSMALIAIVALAWRLPPRRVPLVAAAVAVGVVTLALLLPSARLVTRFGDLEVYGNDRSPVWHDTFQLIRTYPFFGCGLGAYGSAFLEFKHSSPALYQDYAHNDYLQYLAEMGVVGFALLILPLSAVLLRLYAGILDRRPDMHWLSLACAGSALAIGLHSFVDFNFYVPANLFTFAWILGISASLGQQARPIKAAP
jgi:O-antigen ligase